MNQLHSLARRSMGVISTEHPPSRDLRRERERCNTSVTPTPTVMLCRNDILKNPRAPEREQPPAPDPIEIGAGNRSRSRARFNLSFFRRSTSVFYRAHDQGSSENSGLRISLDLEPVRAKSAS